MVEVLNMLIKRMMKPAAVHIYSYKPNFTKYELRQFDLVID